MLHFLYSLVYFKLFGIDKGKKKYAKQHKPCLVKYKIWACLEVCCLGNIPDGDTRDRLTGQETLSCLTGESKLSMGRKIVVLMLRYLYQFQSLYYVEVMASDVNLLVFRLLHKG